MSASDGNLYSANDPMVASGETAVKEVDRPRVAPSVVPAPVVDATEMQRQMYDLECRMQAMMQQRMDDQERVLKSQFAEERRWLSAQVREKDEQLQLYRQESMHRPCSTPLDVHPPQSLSFPPQGLDPLSKSPQMSHVPPSLHNPRVDQLKGEYRRPPIVARGSPDNFSQNLGTRSSYYNPKFFPLPSFAGTDDSELQFTVWECDFADEMMSAGVASGEWIRYLRRALTGKALAAYLEFLSIDPSLSYGSMVDRLRRRFDQKKTPAEYQKECDRLEWNERSEKIEDFGERCFAACTRAKRQLDPVLREYAVKWDVHTIFLRCMPYNIRQMLRGCIRNEDDPDAAVDLSCLVKWVRRFLDDKEADSILDRDKHVLSGAWDSKPRSSNFGGDRDKSPTRIEKRVSFSSRPTVVPAENVSTDVGKSSAQAHDPQAKGKQEFSRAPFRDTRICYHCNEPGHVRPHCPKMIAERRSAQTAARSVNTVNGQGNTDQSDFRFGSGSNPKMKSKAKPRKRKRQVRNPTWPGKVPDQPKSAQLKQNSFDSVLLDATPLKENLLQKPSLSYCAETMMYLPMKIEGVDIDAQIDTGSPIVLINGDVLKIISDSRGRDFVSSQIRPAPRSFYDVQGNVLQLSGIIDVDFYLNDAKVTCPAFISLKMSRPVLIGLSFFQSIGMEMTITTTDPTKAIKWVLSPSTVVNGDAISVFFGRRRKLTLQEKGEKRRQQLLNRRDLKNKVGAIHTAQNLFPSQCAENRAVLVRSVLLGAKQASFIRMSVPNSNFWGANALVTEIGLLNEAEQVIPDQLVFVGKDGIFLVEIQNHSPCELLLHPGELIVELNSDAKWVDGPPQQLPPVPCAKCRRLQNKDVVSLVFTPPAKPNLVNLNYSSLSERQKLIRERASVSVNNMGITQEHKEAVLNFLEQNHDVIALDDYELGECTLSEHAHIIDTAEHTPIAIPRRRIPFGLRAGEAKTIQTMLSTGVIRPSKSPWSSPIVPVLKPDGSVRVCVDYRLLNNITKKDKYPLTRCDDLIDSIGEESPEIFSTLDLVQGYHQQMMDVDSIEKTAFTCSAGHFEYTRLPMGLTNSPASFQRLQTELLKGVDGRKVKVYLDDVAILTKSAEAHLDMLDVVFERFRRAGLRVKLKKCHFLCNEVLYLGYVVNKQGMLPNPKRLEMVAQAQPPTTLKEVRQFLGLCSFYRRFVKNFSAIARPMNMLLQKDVPWVWGPEQQKAFEELKGRLVTPPILRYPRFNEPFYIFCDASANGLGAILNHQKDDKGAYHPVAYASRSTHKTEQNYSATELECLCVTWALQNFHYYIWNQEVTVECDHQPLIYLKSKLKLPSRIERWNSIISSYQPIIKYRRGVENEPADMLSRYQKIPGSADDIAVDLDGTLIGVISDTSQGRDSSSVDSSNQRQLQLADPFFGDVIRALEDTSRPGTSKSKEKSDKIQKLAQHYSMIDTVLYFKGRSAHTMAPPRICVPLVERDKLIQIYHQDKYAGAHFAADKTYRTLQQKFFWPSMQSDVRYFCRSCLTCARERGVERRKRPPLTPVPVPTEPFAQIGIDVMKLNRTKDGYEKVLGVVDYFSGYLIFVPLKDEKAETVARKLVDHVFNIFGAPKICISDQGVNFTSILLKELEKIYKIGHRFTTTFLPRCNGKIERANRTIKTILTRMKMDYPEDWSDLLSHATFAYNNSPQDSTGYSPQFVVFGRHPQPINDAVFDRQSLGHKVDLDDYVSDFERKLAYTHKIVSESILQSQKKYKKYSDRTTAVSKIVVGDSVMLFRPDLKNSKLAPSFDGPFTVVWRNDTNAGLKRVGSDVLERHNIDKLSRCPVTMSCPTVNAKPRKLKSHFRRPGDVSTKKGGGDIEARYDFRDRCSSLCLIQNMSFAGCVAELDRALAISKEIDATIDATLAMMPPAPFLASSELPPPVVMPPPVVTSPVPPAPFLASSELPPPVLMSSVPPFVTLSKPPAPFLASSGSPPPVVTSSEPPTPFLTSSGQPPLFLASSGSPPPVVTSRESPPPVVTSAESPLPVLTSSVPPPLFVVSSESPAPFLASSVPPPPFRASSSAQATHSKRKNPRPHSKKMEPPTAYKSNVGVAIWDSPDPGPSRSSGPVPLMSLTPRLPHPSELMSPNDKPALNRNWNGGESWR